MVVYFSLGTNLGDKEQNLRMAVQKIRKQIGEVISLSAFYATAPWGFSSDNTFLNAALCVDTALAPLEVLQTTQEIEREMGRTHKSVNAVYSDRVIDIDLLLCFADDGTPVLLDTPELKLPHPLMQERRFVMEPLAEIASGVVHPGIAVYGNITDKALLLKNLQQNCIPETILQMEHTNYEEFLAERRKLMAKKIKKYYYSL